MNLGIKNPQLAKELRPLQWPWIGAVVAGSLLALRPMVEGVGLESLLMGTVLYGFFGGMALLAAVSFGGEFQERTLSLLLTQPLPRSRIWRLKISSIAVAVISAILVEGLILSAASAWYSGGKLREVIKLSFDTNAALLAAIFIIATVCSCAYWTLVARSIIGGLVFTISAQFVAALAVALISAWLGNQPELFRDSTTFAALACTGLIYSVVFFWLGRRKFLVYEVKQTQFGGAIPSENRFSSKVPAMLGLVSKPNERLLNFSRKELRLLKPVVQMGAILVFCWIAVAVFQWLRPQQQVTYLFDMLVCLYAPITCLLAGCLSLGEEKTMGLADSQLTLPLSPRIQYLLKLITCVSTGAVLGLGLPWLLFWITGGILDLRGSGLMDAQDKGMLVLICISGVAFILAFWGSTHVSNTVRAALVTIVGTIAVGVCFGLGAWFANQTGGVLLNPLINIMYHFHLSPELVHSLGMAAETIQGFFLTGMIVLVMLYQGFNQFRRAERIAARFFVHALVIAALIFGITLFSIDYTIALQRLMNSTPVAELRHALNAIASRELDSNKGAGTVQPEQLEGRVSPETMDWLRGATVSYRPIRTTNPRRGESGYQATVTFPNGSTFFFVGGFVSVGHGRAAFY